MKNSKQILLFLLALGLILMFIGITEMINPKIGIGLMLVLIFAVIYVGESEH